MYTGALTEYSRASNAPGNVFSSFRDMLLAKNDTNEALLAHLSLLTHSACVCLNA